MKFTKISGPVLEILGIQVDSLSDDLASYNKSNLNLTQNDSKRNVWNQQERERLQAKISAREPFLDFVFSRENADGSQQKFQVSGEPMFDWHCRFIGYRGIGVELTTR